MRNLQAYIDRQNTMRRLFRKPEYNIKTLTQSDVNDLIASMDGDMSPENLHCDGEISAAEARRKAKIIRGAYNELEKIADTNGFNIPNTYCL